MDKICIQWEPGHIAELCDGFFIYVTWKMRALERETKLVPPAQSMREEKKLKDDGWFWRGSEDFPIHSHCKLLFEKAKYLKKLKSQKHFDSWRVSLAECMWK